jgi:hypothetical protein
MCRSWSVTALNRAAGERTEPKVWTQFYCNVTKAMCSRCFEVHRGKFIRRSSIIKSWPEYINARSINLDNLRNKVISLMIRSYVRIQTFFLYCSSVCLLSTAILSVSQSSIFLSLLCYFLLFFSILLLRFSLSRKICASTFKQVMTSSLLILTYPLSWSCSYLIRCSFLQLKQRH